MSVKIVSKELALKLKELGFDMEVNRYYSLVGGDDPDCLFFEDKESNFNDCYFKHEGKEYPSSISAPTYDEVLHWLRDKHGVHGEVRNLNTYDDKLRYYSVLEVYNTKKWYDTLIDNDRFTHDYDKAQLAIINKAIEILEEQLKTKEHE